MKLFRILKERFIKGNERSIQAKINIIYMLILKGATILVNLMLVPMTLNYVNSETYGIWLTLSSMVAWISFFDIGINNGLKNKLTEAIANKDFSLGKKYVSTSYCLLTIIFVPLMLVLLLCVPYIDWEGVLNIEVQKVEGLVASILLVVVYFCMTFILSTINIIMTSFQKPALAALRTLFQHVLSLIIIYILTKTTQGSLINLCLALCISPIFVLAFYNIFLFSNEYKTLAPSLKFIDFDVVPSLMKLGVKFFIIQIAAIIQYQMVNFLIIRYYGASDVTNYNIAYKYFSVLFMFWGILITPFWAAVTDAITKKDYKWILNAKRKYLKTLVLFMIVGICMLIISPWIYKMWIGSHINISFKLSLSVMIYYFVVMFGQIYVTILNGWGKLNVQTIASLFSPVVFLVMCHIFVSCGWGVYSIIIASTIANFNGLVLAPIQFNRSIKSVQ